MEMKKKWKCAKQLMHIDSNVFGREFGGWNGRHVRTAMDVRALFVYYRWWYQINKKCIKRRRRVPVQETYGCGRVWVWVEEKWKRKNFLPWMFTLTSDSYHGNPQREPRLLRVNLQRQTTMATKVRIRGFTTCWGGRADGDAAENHGWRSEGNDGVLRGDWWGRTRLFLDPGILY